MQGRREPSPRMRRCSRQPSWAASRVVKGRVARHASWLLNWFRGKLDGYMPYRASRGRTYGGEVVELMDQVYWKVVGKTKEKFEDCRWLDIGFPLTLPLVERPGRQPAFS